MDKQESSSYRSRRRRRMQSRWWQPSVEDYYSPFDPHFDESADSDDNEDEEDELEVELTRGDFNVLSPELLMRISGFLDLESLCRVSSLSRALKRSFDSPRVWADRIQSTLHIPVSQLSDIKDKKHWFLYQMCIAPHRRAIKTMSEQDRLELEFEQKLLFHKISYNSWALPLRLLHSPLQDNVTILLMILQSVLVFGKLEGQLDAWPWFSIFAPVWIFDVLFFVCCVIWFYFLAKSLLPKDYADVCLSGWLKDVLEAVQLAHSWFDYMLFAMASALSFLIFPLLLTLQLDVFSGLYFIGGGANAQLNSSLNSSAFLAGSSALLPSSLLSFRLSWSGIFASPTLASLIVLHMLHKRFAFCRRNRRYYRLGIALFLFIVTICSGVFTTLMGLHLDNYLPMWWSWWYTATPVWIAAGVGVVMLGGGFNLTQRTSWWRRLQNTPYSMTRAPLIGLLVIFIALLVHRGEVLALASRTPAPPPNSISNHLNINAQPSIHRMDASYPPASSISPSPSAPKISINSAKNGDISSKNSNSAPKNSATAQPASVVASLDPSFLFPFSFLFGLEAVLVLYWVQDLVDFGGHKSYTMRKQFNFSLSAHTDELEDNEPLVDPLDLLVQI